MKTSIIVVLCLFMAQTANCQWIESGKRQVRENEITTFQKQDKTDFRKNAMDTPFFKTAFKFEVVTGDKKIKIQLEDHFYIDPENPEFVPAVYVDEELNTVYLFVWEKDEASGNYGMSGYVYEYNIKQKNIKKEVVFEHGNFGWFSYFTKADDGNIFLRHFSYAGNLDLMSIKNKNGNWKTGSFQNITPDEAKERYLKQL